MNLFTNYNHKKTTTLIVENEIIADTGIDVPNEQILLIEDNALIQRVLKHQLEKLKVEVHTADNGAQALEKIQANDYILIITDIGLPDQDGCEVAVAIHRYQTAHRRSLTPIIALSAHIDETEQQRCLAAGMIRAWNKPLDEQKIQEIAAILISSPRIY